jgi:hypothetical protein
MNLGSEEATMEQSSDILYPGAKYPRWAPGPRASILAAYLHGVIRGIRYSAGGGPEEGQTFLFKTPYGPLQVEDEPFELFQWTTVRTEPHRLFVRLRGEEGVSEWLSSDQCETWMPASAYWRKVSGDPGGG